MTTYLLYPKGTGSFVEAPPTDVIAKYLATPTAPVFIASNSPVAGMVLIATSATNATWQNPTAFTTINDLRINGNVTNTATAAGTRSVALGRNTYAAGVDSITLGPNTITGTSKSVVVGNDCSTVARTYEADGDQCVIIGSSNVITNAGGPGLGATYDYGIILGANNVLTYGSGGNYERGKNAVIGTGNVITMNHSFGGRRNYFMVSDHTISTDIAHGSSITSNIIIGYGGSYTSDNTAASNNVIIGSTPTWTGCNNSVVIGPNNVPLGAKTAVILGSAITTFGTFGVNLIAIGSTITFSGVSSSPVIAIGSDLTISNVANYAIVIGRNSYATASAGPIVIGYNCGGLGDYSVALGGNGTHTTGTGHIAIGKNTATVGPGGCIAMGTDSSAIGRDSVVIGPSVTSSGDYTVAMGLNSLMGTNTDDSVAIGHGATIDNGCYSSVQLGTGTTTTPNTLKFNNFKIHDGATYAESKIVYKEATTGNYTTNPGQYNMSVSSSGAFQGVIAGRNPSGNSTVFSDYDPGFGRDNSAWQFDTTYSPDSCSFVYRDGINFCNGLPISNEYVHGFDQGWGANTFWRFQVGRTTTNDDCLIPLIQVPPAHILHMELTITACRIAGWVPEPGNLLHPRAGHYDPYYVDGSGFKVDTNKIGGRSWSGIAGFTNFGSTVGRVMGINNNWGGNKSDSDLSPYLVTLGSVFTTGSSAVLSFIPIVGPAAGAIVQIASQSITLVGTGIRGFFGGPKCGFSRFDADLGNFGDYEIQGIGYFDIPTHAIPFQKYVGVVVKGKGNHFVEWRVTARCTIAPFADPFGDKYP